MADRDALARLLARSHADFARDASGWDFGRDAVGIWIDSSVIQSDFRTVWSDTSGPRRHFDLLVMFSGDRDGGWPLLGLGCTSSRGRGTGTARRGIWDQADGIGVDPCGS